METLSERDTHDPVRVLKAAFADLVDKCGGLVPASTRIGYKSHSYLQAMASPNKPDQARIDIVFVLEKWAGDATVTRALAAMHGYDLVPRADGPVSMPGNGDDPFLHAADNVSTEADLMHDAKRYRADGEYDHTEIADLIQKSERSLQAKRRAHETLIRIGNWVKAHRKSWRVA